MPVRIFDSETWIKIGQPDLGSKMFYVDKVISKKFIFYLIFSCQKFSRSDQVSKINQGYFLLKEN